MQNAIPVDVWGLGDDRRRLTAIESSIFDEDTEGWTHLDTGVGDKYAHAQGDYLDGPLRTPDGIPRYALQDGKLGERVRLRTDEEIQADRDAMQQQPEPSGNLEARVEALDQTVQHHKNILNAMTGEGEEYGVD